MNQLTKKANQILMKMKKMNHAFLDPSASANYAAKGGGQFLPVPKSSLSPSSSPSSSSSPSILPGAAKQTNLSLCSPPSPFFPSLPQSPFCTEDEDLGDFGKLGESKHEASAALAASAELIQREKLLAASASSAGDFHLHPLPLHLHPSITIFWLQLPTQGLSWNKDILNSAIMLVSFPPLY
jgi:hypothetical protein